jgi:hypothetical protein
LRVDQGPAHAAACDHLGCECGDETDRHRQF